MHTRALHSHVRRNPRRALLALSVAALAAGCSEAPSSVGRQYGLSEASEEALADYPETYSAQLVGTLEMLFGDPQDPGYMQVEDWVDEGYNPNWPWWPEDDNGSGEISEDQQAEIIAGNEQRFARRLALIAKGEYDEVGAVRGAPGLTADWEALLTEREDFEDDESFQESATLTFTEYYPSLFDSAELYRVQCLHCHGNEGGGDGPTAPFLNPLPRDYRHGAFKFTAVKDKARPRRADLEKVLQDGVYGTAMPSFRRFSDAELNGLVDYVRLLSIRGEVERLLVGVIVDDEEPVTPQIVTETYLDVWEKWHSAPQKFFAFDGEVPHPTPEMLERGRELFNDTATGNCASCHGELGLGDGASAFTEVDGVKVSAYNDDWGHVIVPRDLTVGVYRAGKRPIDIYRKIYAGINGTPMPALGDAKDADGNQLLSDQDLWSLVHYVRSLSETSDQIGLNPHPLLSKGADAHGAAEHDGEHESAPESEGSHSEHGR